MDQALCQEDQERRFYEVRNSIRRVLPYCFPILLVKWFFFLPCSTRGENVRPEVFVMAQAIASGQRLNLAVLVLTCLYRFLSEVVTDEEPGKRQLGGPLPYPKGWLGLSFFLREEKVGASRIKMTLLD